MPGDYLPDNLKALWQELSTNPLQISPDQLRKETETLRKALRRRTVIGLGVSLFIAVAFTRYFFILPNNLQRVGSILTVIGATYILVQLRIKAARAIPDLGETDCIPFYRAELERQRDFHCGSWLWSRLLVFLPGPLIFCVGDAQAHPELRVNSWLTFAAFLILAAIAVPLNLRLARKYQSRIDSLDRSQKELQL